jgi:osomolarity two-component system, sensor histidine kinase NIK1
MMQTILKCATLGGSLLEKSKEPRMSAADLVNDEFSALPIPVPVVGRTGTSSSDKKLLRPVLENRALTTGPPTGNRGTESPSIVTADQQDPLEWVGIKTSSAIVSLTEVADPTPVA